MEDETSTKSIVDEQQKSVNDPSPNKGLKVKVHRPVPDTYEINPSPTQPLNYDQLAEGVHCDAESCVADEEEKEEDKADEEEKEEDNKEKQEAGRPALSKLAKAMMASGVWKAGGNVMDNLLAAARLPTNAFERLSELPGQALVRLADGPAKAPLPPECLAVKELRELMLSKVVETGNAYKEMQNVGKAKLDALGRLRDQMQQVVCLKTRCQATRDELKVHYKEAFIFGVPVRYPEWKGCKLAYKKAYREMHARAL